MLTTRVKTECFLTDGEGRLKLPKEQARVICIDYLCELYKQVNPKDYQENYDLICRILEQLLKNDD